MEILDDSTSLALLYKQHPDAYKPAELGICKVNAAVKGVSLGQQLEDDTLDGLVMPCTDLKPFAMSKFALFLNRWLGFNVLEMKFWRRIDLGRCLNCGSSKAPIVINYQYDGSAGLDIYFFKRMRDRYLFKKQLDSNWHVIPNFFAEGALLKCQECGCDRFVTCRK